MTVAACLQVAGVEQNANKGEEIFFPKWVKNQESALGPARFVRFISFNFF
jgi:hypothetical protein